MITCKILQAGRTQVDCSIWYIQPAHKWVEFWLVPADPAEIRTVYDFASDPSTLHCCPRISMQIPQMLHTYSGSVTQSIDGRGSAYNQATCCVCVCFFLFSVLLVHF